MPGRRLTSVLSIFATLLVLTFATGAKAAVFDFSFVSTAGWDVSGSGQFITADGGSPYQVLGITGSLIDAKLGTTPLAITGLSNYAGASNVLFYPGPPYVSFEGISFLAGGYQFNLFTQDDGSQSTWYLESFWAPEGYPDSFHPISLTVSAVPELSTWAMIILGFFGIGLLAHRRNGAVAQMA